MVSGEYTPKVARALGSRSKVLAQLPWRERSQGRPAPVLAGWLYDRTQGYAGAMAVAAAVNLIGALMALSLPGTQDARAPARAAAGEH